MADVTRNTANENIPFDELFHERWIGKLRVTENYPPELFRDRCCTRHTIYDVRRVAEAEAPPPGSAKWRPIRRFTIDVFVSLRNRESVSSLE